MLCSLAESHDEMSTECEGSASDYSGSQTKITQRRSLPQTIRARDEKCDECLSVLEICRESVSWRRGRCIAIAPEIFIGQSDFPLLLVANEGLGCFGLPGAIERTE